MKHTSRIRSFEKLFTRSLATISTMQKFDLVALRIAHMMRNGEVVSILERQRCENAPKYDITHFDESMKKLKEDNKNPPQIPHPYRQKEKPIEIRIMELELKKAELLKQANRTNND